MGLRTWLRGRQHLQSEPELRAALKRLTPVLDSVELVIDAGAYTGGWTAEFSCLFPRHADWLLIEPQTALHTAIAKPGT